MSTRNLYVFGIGGTGARVLRSFTMLLAAGVDFDAECVIPILMDQEVGNGDTIRTANVLSEYDRINKIAYKDENYTAAFGQGKKNSRFFSARIHNPQVLSRGFKMSTGAETHETFNCFINKTSISRESKALMEVLFSSASVEKPLGGGFFGRPNIGCIVMSGLDKNLLSKLFQEKGFDNTKDKIFIISSIFGGTGASGFPLLLKILREWDNVPVEQDTGPVPPNNVANTVSLPRTERLNAVNRSANGVADIGNSAENSMVANISSATIGAITVLPYFSIEKGEIDSELFYTKSIVAMKYYKEDIIGGRFGDTQNSIDYLYSIADADSNATEKQNSSGVNQKNNANFIDLAAALAIFNFVRKETVPQTQHHTKILRFAVAQSNKELDFSDLTQTTNKIFAKAFTQLWLFSRFFLDHDVLEGKILKNKVFDKKLCTSDDDKEVCIPIYQDKLKNIFNMQLGSALEKIRPFMKEFCGDKNGDGVDGGYSYIYELSRSSSFKPFSIDDNKKNAISDRIRYKSVVSGKRWYDFMLCLKNVHDKLDKSEIKGNYSEEEKVSKLLSLFWNTTSEFVDEIVKDWKIETITGGKRQK